MRAKKCPIAVATGAIVRAGAKGLLLLVTTGLAARADRIALGDVIRAATAAEARVRLPAQCPRAAGPNGLVGPARDDEIGQPLGVTDANEGPHLRPSSRLR